MVVGFAGGGTPGHLFMGGGVFRKKKIPYKRALFDCSSIIVT